MKNLITQHYRDNYRKLVKRAHRSLGDFHLGEDCVQETYERALKYAHRQSEGDHLNAWMNVVYFNTMLKYKDFIRSKGVTIEVKPDTEVLFPSGLLSEGSTLVEEEIDKYKAKPKIKKLLLLYFIKGYTMEEVSIFTGAKKPSVDYQTRRFRNYVVEKYSVS